MIDLGPIRSRLERTGRTSGPYFASILDSVHNGSNDLRDWAQSQDDELPDYSISDALGYSREVSHHIFNDSVAG